MSELQSVLASLDTLARADLLKVRAALDARLGKGHIEYKFVKRDGVVYGPYKHLRVWKDGKLTDTYLGKASPEEYADYRQTNT